MSSLPNNPPVWDYDSDSDEEEDDEPHYVNGSLQDGTTNNEHNAMGEHAYEDDDNAAYEQEGSSMTTMTTKILRIRKVR